MTKELTRVEFLCEDQLVGKIQRMLMQVRGAYDFKAVPVVNAEAKPNGKVKAAADGNLVERFAAHLTKNQIKEFKAKEVKDWLVEAGFSPLSSNYVTKSIVKAHLVSKRGKGSATVYTVKS